LSASVLARSTSIEHWRASRQCHPENVIFE
jgi:hypothetical protein